MRNAIIGAAAIALAAITLPTLTLAVDPPPSFDFPISATLNGSGSTNGTVTITNGTPVAVPANADLMVAVQLSSPIASTLRSNVTVGFDTLWGPSGTQRTQNQPISCTGSMTSSNPIVYTCFVSRTNFNGCAGMALDSFGIADSTNGAFIPLTEVSGNWSR